MNNSEETQEVGATGWAENRDFVPRQDKDFSLYRYVEATGSRRRYSV